MATRRLTLDAIANLDGGRVRAAFDQALKRLREDCQDRPALATARKLRMDVILIPTVDEEGNLADVDVRFTMRDTIPARESKAYRMAALHDGSLVFNELSPTDPGQMTIDEIEPPTARTPFRQTKRREAGADDEAAETEQETEHAG
jgi:hypothetical protein